MNGTIPKFYEGRELPKDYYQMPDLYSEPKNSNVNLLELTRYSRKCGKKIIDMTWDEISQFLVHPKTN